MSKYNYADQVKENEAGGISGPDGRGEESVQYFGGKVRRKETTRKIEAKMGSK
jgi:hypothetical protein